MFNSICCYGISKEIGRKAGAQETRGSALSRLPGVTRKSLVRRLSRRGDRKPPRCILICTLTDSFPILIYKQITPLFKFLRRRVSANFAAYLSSRAFPLNFLHPSLCFSSSLSLSCSLFLASTKSPLVILSLKTISSLSQLHLRSQCSLVISTASSRALTSYSDGIGHPSWPS